MDAVTRGAAQASGPAQEKAAKTEKDAAKILLRVFFHVHGDRVVLLLCGYDKARHNSAAYQNTQIQEARRLLRAWKA